jgi:hypothetical protein
METSLEELLCPERSGGCSFKIHDKRCCCRLRTAVCTRYVSAQVPCMAHAVISCNLAVVFGKNDQKPSIKHSRVGTTLAQLPPPVSAQLWLKLGVLP